MPPKDQNEPKAKAVAKMVFKKNVRYKGKYYQKGTEVPAALLKDDYINDQNKIEAKVG